MQTQLKRLYFFMLLPALVLFAALYTAGYLKLIPSGAFALGPPWPAMFFIGAAATGVAGPILVRTLFANSVKGEKQVARDTFFTFQKRLTAMACITPYIAFAAMACELPQFHSAAILLMALYALYYHFPSVRRIEFDRKIFRVAP